MSDTIPCPACNTLHFRGQHRPGTKLRCSRCNQIFEVQAPPPSDPEEILDVLPADPIGSLSVGERQRPGHFQAHSPGPAGQPPVAPSVESEPALATPPPPFPGIVMAAGIIWILLGVLGLVNTFGGVLLVILALGKRVPSEVLIGQICAIPVALFIGLAFGIEGILTVRGKSRSLVHNGIGSLVFAFICLIISAVALISGRPVEGGGILLCGLVTTLAGILALAGQSSYRKWRDAKLGIARPERPRMARPERAAAVADAPPTSSYQPPRPATKPKSNALPWILAGVGVGVFLLLLCGGGAVYVLYQVSPKPTVVKPQQQYKDKGGKASPPSKEPKRIFDKDGPARTKAPPRWSEPPFPVDPKLLESARKVYLSDMQEFELAPRPEVLGKHGKLAAPEALPITVAGRLSPKGIELRPTDEKELARARYALGKKAALFQASVAFQDSGLIGPGPVWFAVRGDGKELWRSAVLHEPDEIEDCVVDVSGVDVLELHVGLLHREPMGGNAIWIEPRLYLDRAATDKEPVEPLSRAGGLHAPNPPPLPTGEADPKLLEPGTRVWLSDMREQRLSRLPFSKKGVLYNRQNRWPISACGTRSPHGLGMYLPAHAASSKVRYSLGKKAKVFQAVVASNDLSGKRPRDGVRFVVWGDEKELWASKSVRNPNLPQECLVDVSNVNDLILEVRRFQHQYDEPAVWVEPSLFTDTDAARKVAPLLPFRTSVRLQKGQAPLSQTADELLAAGKPDKVDGFSLTRLKPSTAKVPDCLCLAPDGKHFYYLNTDTNTLHKVALDQLRTVRRLPLGRKCSWISPSGRGLLATLPEIGEMWLIDWQSLEITDRLKTPKIHRAVSSTSLPLAFSLQSPRGEGLPPTLQMYDLQKGERLDGTTPDLTRNAQEFADFRVTADGNSLISHGSCLHRFRIDRMKVTYEQSSTALIPKDCTGTICLSPNNKYVCLVTPGGNHPYLRLSTPDSMQTLLDIRSITNLDRGVVALKCEGDPGAVAFDPTGELVYESSDVGRLAIFPMTGAPPKQVQFKDIKGNCRQILVHPSGRSLLMLGDELIFVELPVK